MFSTRLITGLAAALVLGLTDCDSGQSATTLEPEQRPTDVEETTEPPEPEPTPDEPAIGAVGDTVEITQWDESVGRITVADMQTSNRPYDEYGEGPKNGVFVVFTVDVEADASFDVYEGDFYVLTEDGTRYDVDDGNSIDAVDYDETLGWVELNADEKKSGLLAFDVPTEHGQLAYAPNYDGGPIGVREF